MVELILKNGHGSPGTGKIKIIIAARCAFLAASCHVAIARPALRSRAGTPAARAVTVERSGEVVERTVVDMAQ